MGGACRTYGGEEICVQVFENLSERTYLEDPGLVGRIILRWIFRTWDGEA
jgi:hypothetical protein